MAKFCTGGFYERPSYLDGRGPRSLAAFCCLCCGFMFESQAGDHKDRPYDLYALSCWVCRLTKTMVGPVSRQVTARTLPVTRME